MNRTMVNYLRGFNSFDCSFNLRVLADDQEVGSAYEQAKIRGRLPFNRTKILILGDHGVGKTSTCRRLRGNSFRRDEATTIGIETNTVKANVSDVNSKWCDVSETSLEDYERSAAWWAVSHMCKTNKSEISKTNNRPGAVVKDAIYQGLHIVPLILVFLFIGLNFGFGLFVWAYIICFMPILDVHTAYRAGSGYAMSLVIIIHGQIWLTETYNALPETETSRLVNIIMTMLVYGVLTVFVGLMIGGGGRTGLCVALCFMIPPEQIELLYPNLSDTMMWEVHNVYFGLTIWILTVCSVAIFRYIHGKILHLNRMAHLLLSITVVVPIVILFYQGSHSVLLLKSFGTVVLIFLMVTGCLIGRKCSAYWYVPQNYLIKKSISFIFGICMVRRLGWKFVDLDTLNLTEKQYKSIPYFLLHIMLFFIPIVLFFVYECLSYIKVMNTLSVPLPYIGQSLKAIVRNESYLDARLSLWDFAGQQMYYSTHHLFMPKQGVYLILFNAVEAVMNPDKQIKRLQFWLQSVAMHADVENVVVLLIGTRRESVHDKTDLLYFSTLAKAKLYKRFSKLIVFHPLGNIVFYVENLLSTDKEINTLREVIYNEVQNMKYFQEKFLIKYLLFNEILNKFRQQTCIIIGLNEILEEVKSTCKIMSQNQLRQFLEFFDRAGDVIYNERDEALRNYVICDPQKLVDILQTLVNVPVPHKRTRAVADYWQKLEDTGIVDSRLLEYICQEHAIWKYFPHVLRFLVGTHLLFPLIVTNQVDQDGKFCLPCRLPKIHLTSSIWNNNEHLQDIFYFDFYEFLPEFIFLRLIAKCCEEFDWDKIYYNAARFRTSKSCLFFISTLVISDRNLIKVAVHNEDKAQAVYVLQKMITFIEEIVNRDFNPDCFWDQYCCGPECERCSSVDGKICLVNLITSDNNFISELDGYRPDQYHKILLTPKFSFTCSRECNKQD
ncbi:uncharacterized protein LOC117100089 [Anneissia japonica]|uniref:uncharacterized protein LOC117100089 n=1 Tax=Anneissia japonica TaxID=1529436 RepID=UPI00142595B6|nr:uncharacterized protein LOC117100089 [Anneissia japonica]XP_033095532.1 uncharacterized protein LOC117100089 [Anneissia japonica]